MFPIRCLFRLVVYYVLFYTIFITILPTGPKNACIYACCHNNKARAAYNAAMTLARTRKNQPENRIEYKWNYRKNTQLTVGPFWLAAIVCAHDFCSYLLQRVFSSILFVRKFKCCIIISWCLSRIVGNQAWKRRNNRNVSNTNLRCVCSSFSLAHRRMMRFWLACMYEPRWRTEVAIRDTSCLFRINFVFRLVREVTLAFNGFLIDWLHPRRDVAMWRCGFFVIFYDSTWIQFKFN